MERISLYRLLKKYKEYKDKYNFCEDFEITYLGRRLREINAPRRKMEFDYGMTCYFSHEDYHIVYFSIKEKKK